MLGRVEVVARADVDGGAQVEVRERTAQRRRVRVGNVVHHPDARVVRVGAAAARGLAKVLQRVAGEVRVLSTTISLLS